MSQNARRAEALSSGRYSDINLISKDGDIIPAHRFALLTSSVLATQMRGVHGTNLHVDETNTVVLHAVLKFLYTDDIDIYNAIIVKLLEAPMLLKLPSLEEECRRYMQLYMSEDYYADALVFAEKNHIGWLKEAVIKFAIV